DDRGSLAEVAEGRLRHPEQRVQVGLEHPVELVRRQVLDGVPPCHLVARVVHQDVETPKVARRTVRDAARRRLVPEVTGQQRAAPAGPLDPLRRRPRVLLLLGEVGEGDVGPLAGERDGDRSPDARVASCDQRPVADQLLAADVARLTVVGTRYHAIGRTGRLLLLRGERLVLAHEVLRGACRGPWPVLDLPPTLAVPLFCRMSRTVRNTCTDLTSEGAP